ncbi:MAG: substrate binding domain-containing protein [Nitrosomonas sp.]|nr:substrate binding domain-containing protein [Nitrosomonas sp.]
MGVHIGRLHDSSLIARRLAVSRRVMCCSPAYAQNAGLPVSIDDLANHTCISYANVPSNEIWQFEPVEPTNTPRSLTVRSRIVTSNDETVRDTAIAGLGIAILPVFVAAQALSKGQLIDILPDEHPVADTIYAIYPQSRYIPIKVNAIINYLRTAFREDPAWNGLES